MEFLLDGRRRTVPPGSRLSDVLEGRDPACTIAVVRPAAAQATQTRTLLVATTRGEVVIELAAPAGIDLDPAALPPPLTIHWADRYAAAFGPFPREFTPSRTPHPYGRGDVLVGCGGYDPRRSYLIFSRIRHQADHGSPAGGGIIGRVVSGGGVLDRWGAGDRIDRIERVVSWEDRTTAFTTTDTSFPLEEGMQVVTRVEAVAQGYTPEKIDPSVAGTVEHMLMVVERGHFHVHRAASTHIRDETLPTTDLSSEEKRFRGEGTVTVRPIGPGSGSVYIYRTDLPGNPEHSVAGQVVHGIELVKLAREGETLCISVTPSRLDLVGMTAADAVKVAAGRGITAVLDDPEDPARLVVDQDPGTTLEVLAKKSVSLTTAPEGKVLGIRLDDARAPASCAHFRQVTGLARHPLGKMPLFFRFDDVLLFRPPLREGMKILPENTPADEVPAFALGMTNDSRKGTGTVGVRTAPNREFGPTAEPFEGTNLIGMVMDTGKLKSLKEKETIYVREVNL
ncbi:MAG: methanogenesis marker 3 protein [Methanomicrobiales archaeon]|nr:methanogenesis marker 3 protein [Methanomicrobiales archaeon]